MEGTEELINGTEEEQESEETEVIGWLAEDRFGMGSSSELLHSIQEELRTECRRCQKCNVIHIPINRQIIMVQPIVPEHKCGGRVQLSDINFKGNTSLVEKWMGISAAQSITLPLIYQEDIKKSEESHKKEKSS